MGACTHRQMAALPSLLLARYAMRCMYCSVCICFLPVMQCAQGHHWPSLGSCLNRSVKTLLISNLRPPCSCWKCICPRILKYALAAWLIDYIVSYFVMQNLMSASATLASPTAYYITVLPSHLTTSIPEIFMLEAVWFTDLVAA